MLLDLMHGLLDQVLVELGALGMIRPAYSHALKSAVRAELDKDLVKQPVHQIEKHLTGA